MAGITIKGDTSGEITLNVPATAGTNTITIPASSGTLAVTSPGGNASFPGTLSAGTISASGNISTPSGTVTASSFVGNGASLTGIAGGFSNMEVFTSPGTWTNPGSITKVKVTVVGGGGSNGSVPSVSGSNSVAKGGAGGGGSSIEIIPFPSATNVAVTVGSAGGTSSFGPYCSATGGAAGTNSTVANSSTNAAGGAGGSGSGGTININGTPGAYSSIERNVLAASGGGGGSMLSSGGGAATIYGTINKSPVVQAGSYGGGDSGWSITNPNPIGIPGGGGQPGVVIVEY